MIKIILATILLYLWNRRKKVKKMKDIHDLLIKNLVVVKHYPYRRGIIMHDDVLLSERYSHGAPLDRLHRHLAEQVKDGLGHPDNHEAYDITANGKAYSLYFSDWNCYLGTKVTERD